LAASAGGLPALLTRVAMIDEEFFMSLPPDPAEAFPIYERHVREKCLSREFGNEPNSDDQRA
jgi:hypothetical protein